MSEFRLKIYVVDDEKPILDWLCYLIENGPAKYELIGFASDVKRALQDIMRNPPDLLITDIIMPGDSGLTLVKECRKNLLDMPIILLTNHANFSFAQEALKLQANDYILKSELTKEQFYILLDKHYRQIAEGREKLELPGEHDISRLLDLALITGNSMAVKYFWSEKGIDMFCKARVYAVYKESLKADCPSIELVIKK